MDDALPTWLRAMENGSLGEARTRAFLVERFWVLERSVDMDGADFLIQRRAAAQRFTDRSPPRVGVVQAKFCQDRGTTHRIPRSYVTDADGAPLEGFFVLLHLGHEDEGTMHLLSAADIVGAMPLGSRRGTESYLLGAEALSGSYLVRSQRLALDRIEHSLKSRTYTQSAAFLDRLHIPFRRFGEDDIDFAWTLPLPNDTGDVRQMFFELKEKLRRLVFDMDEVLTIIDSVLVEKDPRRAVELAADLKHHVGAYGRISFQADPYEWEDFASALDSHDGYRERLIAAGLLEAYLDTGRSVRRAIDEQVATTPLEDDDAFVEVDLRYSADTFAASSVRVRVGIGERGPDKTESGRARRSVKLADWAPRGSNPADYTVEWVWDRVMRAMIASRFPDDEEEEA